MEGVIADMEKKGVKHIHCYCVDNCLVKVGDPTFVGYCAQNECDVAAKCIPKTSPEEQVGLIMAKNGKPSVIEYSELSKTLSELRNDDGQLVYGCANIANHYYTLEFLKRVENFENELEYHIARKKIKHMLPDGSIVTPNEPNGIKLELFIFDVFPFAQKFGLLMVERSQEFSPLKNKSGQDSPETSRKDIINKHIQMVEKVGGIVTVKDGKKQVEVSPLVSYDGEGLESLKGKEVGLTVDSL